MGKFSESMGKLADNAERAALALEGILAAGSDTGGGGLGGGAPGSPAAASGFRAPTTVVFNTTLEGTGGGGGGTGEISRANNGGLSEEIIRAFAFYGLKAGGQSEKRIQEILELFREMMRRNDLSVLMRTGEGG